MGTGKPSAFAHFYDHYIYTDAITGGAEIKDGDLVERLGFARDAGHMAYLVRS